MTATISTFPSSTQPLLEANALVCVRGERKLFSSLSLQVFAGECWHVRGENGVGKTSLLRLLSGLASPESGDILWAGRSIHQEAQGYRQKLLFLGHRDALKEDLTALENLRMYAGIDGIALTDEDAVIALRRFGLKGREDLPVYCLSAGQKKRVLMARMVTRHAQLWILDEPFNALDATAVQELEQLIVDHLKSNGMVILTSHQALAIANMKVLDL
ncbi:cytochrome c biogenesis heme-transporting ATPase CcmA [Polynucleobacter antarcticus]|uniref:Cytochrome c biogenesis heme-transporting ATPase CcmA n=2 Tax=Polynucleobacter antarcticus TaxID=1743162 RepID=A0A6M9PWK0_9BURK|nr:cytochrome c biogenesis heme-transporting ATPase CcmA [Polynucleobacter antarcticus]